MSDQDLVIRDLHVAPVANPEHEILKGIDLTVVQGEVHAIMGPNGSGKSTLAYTLMGHPKYVVTQGSVSYRDQDILTLKPELRARAGMFLSFQYPTAIPGVTMHNFLRTATKAVHGSELPPREFRKMVTEQMGTPRRRRGRPAPQGPRRGTEPSPAPSRRTARWSSR